MKRTNVVLAAVAAVVATSAFGAGFAFDPAKCRIAERHRNHPLFTEPVTGVNFGFGGHRGYYAAHMDEPKKMKEMGVNWCVLKIHPMQEEFCSRKIFFDPVYTVGESETERMVDELHRQGIHVILQPCVMALDSATMFSSFNFPDEHDCQLEGRHPLYWREWFASLREVLAALSDFAERTKCEAMIIGAEYAKTLPREAEWRETIAQVRARYSGLVSYETTPSQPPFAWADALDFVSLSTYPKAVEPADPEQPWADPFVTAEQWNALPDVSKEEMLAYFRDHSPLQAVEKLHKISKGLPVVITETGMISSHGWCRYPSNGMLPHQKGVRTDFTEQANYIDAVFEVFGSSPVVPGLCLWKWDESQNRWFSNPDPMKDGGFRIYGKPAAEIFRKWAALGKAKK